MTTSRPKTPNPLLESTIFNLDPEKGVTDPIPMEVDELTPLPPPPVFSPKPLDVNTHLKNKQRYLELKQQQKREEYYRNRESLQQPLSFQKYSWDGINWYIKDEYGHDKKIFSLPIDNFSPPP